MYNPISRMNYGCRWGDFSGGLNTWYGNNDTIWGLLLMTSFYTFYTFLLALSIVEVKQIIEWFGYWDPIGESAPLSQPYPVITWKESQCHTEKTTATLNPRGTTKLPIRKSVMFKTRNEPFSRPNREISFKVVNMCELKFL